MAKSIQKLPVGISRLYVGQFGNIRKKQIGVFLCELCDYQITQFSFFYDQEALFSKAIQQEYGMKPIADFASIQTGKYGICVRPEPTKLWLISKQTYKVGDAKLQSLSDFYPLDLSAAKVILRISGSQAKTVLNRQMAVDLSSLKGGFIASSIHHVPVHLLKNNDENFDLIIPRTYAESIAHLIFDIALQFGVCVDATKAWSVSD